MPARQDVIKGIARMFIRREAAASVALDGETQSMATDHEGYGCPGCGGSLDLASLHARDFTIGLPCCGYLPRDREVRRWVAAGRLLRAH